MVLLHNRNQHPVGQGFFHTAYLGEGGKVFRYVFDCGSMSTYRSHRVARVRAYHENMFPNRFLDVLFISHAHADHLNGVEHLLTGLEVDTIVLPLMNVADRLIAFGRDLVEDAASVQDSFYRDFIIDPRSAVSRFRPRQILFVRPRHDDGGAPGSDGSGFDGPDGGRDIGGIQKASRLGWKLVGRGSVDLSMNSGAKADEPMTAIIEDRQALAVVCDSLRFWLLAPYVDPSVEADRRLFMRALAAELRTSGAKSLARKINKLSVSDLRMIVATQTAALSSAYARITKNLNTTSMCLYSGLAPIGPDPIVRYNGSFGEWSITPQVTNRVAWLTTADAALADPKRRGSFLKHFGDLLSRVITMTLPHHGSEQNFHNDLVSKIKPNNFVVSADHYATWRHPSSSVVQNIASSGGVVWVATSSVRSAISERVELS